MAFYYKWTDEYIGNMPNDSFKSYLQASYVLENENYYKMARASLIPKLKKTRIDKFFTDISNNIKNSFEKRISSVNAKYLASQMLKDD